MILSTVSGKVPIEVKDEIRKISKKFFFKSKSHLVGWILTQVIAEPLVLARVIAREKCKELNQAQDLVNALEDQAGKIQEERPISFESLRSH